RTCSEGVPEVRDQFQIIEIPNRRHQVLTLAKRELLAHGALESHPERSTPGGLASSPQVLSPVDFGVALEDVALPQSEEPRKGPLHQLVNEGPFLLAAVTPTVLTDGNRGVGRQGKQAQPSVCWCVLGGGEK